MGKLALLPTGLVQLVLLSLLVQLCSVPWWGVQKSAVSPGGDCRLLWQLVLLRQLLSLVLLLLLPAVLQVCCCCW